MIFKFNPSMAVNSLCCCDTTFSSLLRIVQVITVSLKTKALHSSSLQASLCASFTSLWQNLIILQINPHFSLNRCHHRTNIKGIRKNLQFKYSGKMPRYWLKVNIIP